MRTRQSSKRDNEVTFLHERKVQRTPISVFAAFTTFDETPMVEYAGIGTSGSDPVITTEEKKAFNNATLPAV